MATQAEWNALVRRHDDGGWLTGGEPVSRTAAYWRLQLPGRGGFALAKGYIEAGFWCPEAAARAAAAGLTPDVLSEIPDDLRDDILSRHGRSGRGLEDALCNRDISPEGVLDRLRQVDSGYRVGSQIRTGTPGTEGYYTGCILEVDGDHARVGWADGSQTREKMADLRPL